MPVISVVSSAVVLPMASMGWLSNGRLNWPLAGISFSTKKPPSGTPVSWMVILSPARMASALATGAGRALLEFEPAPPHPVRRAQARKALIRTSVFIPDG